MHTDWPVDSVSKPGVAFVSPKNGGTVPIRKVVVLVSVAGEKLNVGLPGESGISYFGWSHIGGGLRFDASVRKR